LKYVREFFLFIPIYSLLFQGVLGKSQGVLGHEIQSGAWARGLRPAGPQGSIFTITPPWNSAIKLYSKYIPISSYYKTIFPYHISVSLADAPFLSYYASYV